MKGTKRKAVSASATTGSAGTNTTSTSTNSPCPDGSKTKETPSSQSDTFSVGDLSNELIQHRLWAGLGKEGGARGSLAKCATHWIRLQQEKQENVDSKLSEETVPNAAQATAAPAESNQEAAAENKNIANCKQALIAELQLQQLEMTKLLLLNQRQKYEGQDFVQQCKRLRLRVQKERQRATRLRRQLDMAQTVTTFRREYEALAKMAAGKHPTPRRQLKQNMDAIKSQLQTTKTQLSNVLAMKKIRESQFHALFQCILDLRQSFDEPLDKLQIDTTTTTTATSTSSAQHLEKPISTNHRNDADTKNGHHEHETKDSANDNNAPSRMEVDATDTAAAPKGSTQEENLNLYDDLS